MRIPRMIPPNQPDIDVGSAENPPSESDFATAIQMIETLPVSDDEKAEAIRRVLAGPDA